jgi:hypothetical protein
MQSVTRIYSRSHDAVIRVYDAAGNVIETHEHKGDVKSVLSFLTRKVSTSLTRLE